MRKWKIFPKIEFINYKKEYGELAFCFKDWFYIRRYWGKRIIIVGVKHYALSLDFRYNWLSDFIGIKLI